MIYSKILFTGAYVPENSISNDDLSTIVDTNDEWIRTRSGIEQRYFSRGENTSDIAAKAGLDVLNKGNINPKDIDLIIVATVSGDYTTPSTACLVQVALGAENAVAFDISAACSGFIFAMSVADKYIRSGVYRNALVIGAEVLSKYLDFTDRGTCVLFGDGAAGVYMEASDTPGILAEDMGSDGSRGLALTCGHRKAENGFFGTNRDENSFLQMDGRAVFDFATRQTPKCIRILLEKSGIPLEKIRYVIPHQANIRIVEVISRKLKIPMEKFYMNLNQYGNTSSATIPIALNEMMEKGMLQKDDIILIVGFGGGLTWGGMMIQL